MYKCKSLDHRHGLGLLNVLFKKKNLLNTMAK